MERRAFLQALAAAGAAVDLPPDTDAMQTGPPGVLIPAEEDRGGTGPTIARCKLSGKDTNGALAIFGGEVKGAGGVPLHVHLAQDEWWYVLEGEHLFQVGDRKFHARAGDAVFGPRGVPHSPRQLTERGAVLTAFQPAGTMEAFFHELMAAAQKDARLRPPPATMAAIFEAHGMKIVGPMVER
jgi:quercetin 2,3-dioxygenase